MAAPSAGTLPVYLRIGATPEAHIGDLDVQLVPQDAATARVVIDLAGTLPDLLRAAADEIEHPSDDDEPGEPGTMDA